MKVSLNLSQLPLLLCFYLTHFKGRKHLNIQRNSQMVDGKGILNLTDDTNGETLQKDHHFPMILPCEHQKAKRIPQNIMFIKLKSKSIM